MFDSIHPRALWAISMLERCGYHAYLVGGCVRDMLLNTLPQDWDITTDALPEEILDCFRDYHTLTMGQKHGTIVVVCSDISLEITTHRIDGNYQDGRRPDRVYFTKDLSQDLKRRDFTINAMAYDIQGKLYDEFGGQEDLKNGVIRCVGNSDVRFLEDALRLLRALRFSAQLGFSIEPETKEAICRHAEKLYLVSRERITVEFLKMLSSKDISGVLPYYKDIWKIFLPFVTDKVDLCLLAKLLSQMPKNDMTRLALFCGAFMETKVDLSKNALAKLKNKLKGLSLSRQNICDIFHMLYWVDNPPALSKFDIKKGLEKTDTSSFERYLSYEKVMHPARAQKLSTLYEDILQKKECYHIKDLAIRGGEIASLCPQGGAQISKILSALLLWVMEYPENNTYEMLYHKACQILETKLL